jgi:hypothetical protein
MVGKVNCDNKKWNASETNVIKKVSDCCNHLVNDFNQLQTPVSIWHKKWKEDVQTRERE